MATKRGTTAKKADKNKAAGKEQVNESFKVRGEELLVRVKDLIHEGNVREITIKDKEGKVIVVIPLTIGVVGSLLVPPLAIVGTLAALVSECSIEVKRKV